MVVLRFFFVSLLFFFVFSPISQLSDNTAENKSVRILSKTLIGDDDSVYAFSNNDFFSFESNGSISWSVQMNFKCYTGLSPGLFWFRRENRILRVNFPRNAIECQPKLFFDPGEMILGLHHAYCRNVISTTWANG